MCRTTVLFQASGQKMNDFDTNDVTWEDPDSTEFTYGVIYDTEPSKPRSINPIAWIKYFKKKWRGEGELLAYWDLGEDGLYRNENFPNVTMEWKDTVEIDWRDKQ